VRRFRNGDPAAFEEIYAEFGTSIFRTCLRLCGNRADAEDLTAETFLAAFHARERFEGRSSIRTWLFRIAFHKWRAFRDHPSRHCAELVEEIESHPPGIEDLAIEQALRKLPEDLRVSFLLVKAEGLRYREAAEALGIPQGTVQFRVHEAAKRLRRLLEDEPLPKAERCGHEL
jgi:RNA polymerase sigma-70 factor, ECF subfamily